MKWLSKLIRRLTGRADVPVSTDVEAQQTEHLEQWKTAQEQREANIDREMQRIQQVMRGR